MKQSRFILLMVGIVMLVTSCRKEGDDLVNPNKHYNNNKSYAVQFQSVWNGINNSYVFWDIDTVDWDAKYDMYLPKFQALDSKASVTDSEFIELWRGVVGRLRDHHFVLTVKNYKTGKNHSIGGGSRDVKERPDYRDTAYNDQYAALANHIKLDTLFVNTKGCNMRSA